MFLLYIIFSILVLSTQSKHLKKFEGDILGGIHHLKFSHRNSLVDDKYKWKDGIVPYIFDQSMPVSGKTIIQSAFATFQTFTCIKFVTKRATDVDYIRIQNKPGGCYSYLGKTGGEQALNLQYPDCFVDIGPVYHEIMHALGFLHEHTRPDRDDYVTILWQNIKRGYETDFKIIEGNLTTSFGEPYDYKSVMHYPPNAFSINKRLNTIVPKPPAVLGWNTVLSELDKEKIKMMYNCTQN